VVQKRNVSALFLLFPLLLAAVFGTYLYISVGSNAATTCTQLVPDSANVTFFANSTIAGATVTYGNGTTSFYQAGTCPQPVHENLYQAVSAVSQDPHFIKDENGSQFTVDPINSLANPLDLQNGSTYEELIFDDLNLSDPIFPCNLNLIYSNPIAEIYVFIPVSANGTLVYANETVAAYPGNELQFNCPSETGLQTFAKSQITPQFQVGGFNFNLISNGTDFVGANSTSYPGYDYVFNITYTGTPGQNVTQQVVFTWPTAGAFSSGDQPTQFMATPFDAYVVMRWFTNSTGLFLTVTTLA
jgi:hypothetical protein